MKITKLDDTSHVLPRPVWQTLEVGSMVQFGNPVQYGVIKLIKDSHSNREKLAGIETVIKFFNCYNKMQYIECKKFCSVL